MLRFGGGDATVRPALLRRGTAGAAGREAPATARCRSCIEVFVTACILSR
jgi:hypothetical protein